MGKGKNTPNQVFKKVFLFSFPFATLQKCFQYDMKIVRLRWLLEDINIFLEMPVFSVKYVKMHFF